MAKLKLEKDRQLLKALPLDYFLKEKIPISKSNRVKVKHLKHDFKFIEKYQCKLLIRYSPQKPISKLLEPNDF